MANAPNIIQAFQQGNPLAALSAIYNRVEVRTSVSPPAVIDVGQTLDSSQQPSPLVSFLKPTVIFSGPGGRAVIAPYGEAGDGTLFTVLFISGLVGVGVLIGRWSMK